MCPCYGWDTSNGSWGLFWVVFWTCPIKTTPRRTLLYFVLWHPKKATLSVIKLFSEIIDAQCLTDTSQVFDLHGDICLQTFPQSPSLKLVQLHHILFSYIAYWNNVYEFILNDFNFFSCVLTNSCNWTKDCISKISEKQLRSHVWPSITLDRMGLEGWFQRWRNAKTPGPEISRVKFWLKSAY